MSDAVLLTSAMVAKRYSVSKRTIARWSVATDLAFPKRVVINRRPYWRLVDLKNWEGDAVDLKGTSGRSK